MSQRSSRQDLVVSPQASNLRFALTALGCACAGFGVVWASLAVHRLRHATEAPASTTDATTAPSPEIAAAATAVADHPFTARPDSRFGSPSAIETVSFRESRSSSLQDETASVAEESERVTADGEEPALAADRYPARPDFRQPAPRSTPQPTPREAAPPWDDGLLAVAASEPADEESAATAPGPEAIDARVASPDRLEPGLDAAVAPDEPPLDAPDGPTAGADSAHGAAPFAPPPRPLLPEDRGDLPPLSREAPAPVAPSAAADDEISSESVPPAPAAPQLNPFAAAPSPLPSAPDATLSPRPAVPPDTPRPSDSGRSTLYANAPGGGNGFEHDPEAPVPVDALPAGSVAAPRGATGATVGAMPFAAAPPIGPSPPALPGHAIPTPFPPAGPAPTPSGQGRPGAIQLEGVQTPQLAVEKRGPREIQVGKTARFEILVRNVGSAVANEVILRDSVPFGTALVATTPPATPAGVQGAPGELVWLLGTLPPGGQARVALDLMPMTEGDVGSVASVSFRADASVRSRATRPALEIRVEPPSPVLVGLDSRLSISVSNPGSGVATGVVLEGVLPDGLAHRAGRELEFDVGSLPPGESRTIDLVLATTGPGVHGLKLVARADGQIEVAETVKVAVTAPTLELAVQMPSRRYLQRPATCTIAMTNAGTAPAIGVELAAQLPPGMKFVRANNAGYYEERTHRVLWNLEELPAAETGEVEMVVMPIALGPQKIVAAARTTAGLSDQKAHTVEVEGLAALAFEVADSEDPIEVGGTSEYVIRVGNQGTKPASGVRVVATLLGDMEPVDARGPSPHRVDNLTISFEPLAKLAPSEEALYRIRVRGRREGDQRVQVQLTSDDQPAPITKEEITRVYADR